jgi:hypothetical protein
LTLLALKPQNDPSLCCIILLLERANKIQLVGTDEKKKKLEQELKLPQTPDAKRTNLVNNLTFKYIVCFLAMKIAAGKQAT